MIYLFALIGAVAVAYLVWKAFGPQPHETVSRGRGPLGPDDDSDFLLDLDRTGRRDRRPSNGGSATPTDDSGTTESDPPEPRPQDGSGGGAPHRDDPRPGAST